MIQEDGYSAALYDPIFHPDDTVLTQTYDFITCTETVEHFRHTRADFLRLHKLLAPGAYLGIMTTSSKIQNIPRLVLPPRPHPRRLLHPQTLHWIAEWLDQEVEFPRGRVVLFRKPL